MTSPQCSIQAVRSYKCQSSLPEGKYFDVFVLSFLSLKFLIADKIKFKPSILIMNDGRG